MSKLTDAYEESSLDDRVDAAEIVVMSSTTVWLRRPRSYPKQDLVFLWLPSDDGWYIETRLAGVNHADKEIVVALGLLEIFSGKPVLNWKGEG